MLEMAEAPLVGRAGRSWRISEARSHDTRYAEINHWRWRVLVVMKHANEGVQDPLTTGDMLVHVGKRSGKEDPWC